MCLRTLARSDVLVWRCLACAAVAVGAQADLSVSGRLANSLSGDPIPGAIVQIDELRRTVTSAADGTFTFASVPPGTYHLSVHSDGYSTRRTEVTVSTTTA